MTNKARRIAVVDDDRFVLRALRRLLRAAGFEVDTYESGASFLMAVADHEPDCLVLDLHMPQTSGFEVQAHLTDSGKRIPVVVITGDDTPEARLRALSLGAECYLRKPVEKSVLLPAIDAAISSVTHPNSNSGRH